MGGTPYIVGPGVFLFFIFILVLININMSDHNPEPFTNHTIYDFLRQTINSVIEVCNATGDVSTLQSIASGLTDLNQYMFDHAGSEPPEIFSGDYH